MAKQSLTAEVQRVKCLPLKIDWSISTIGRGSAVMCADACARAFYERSLPLLLLGVWSASPPALALGRSADKSWEVQPSKSHLQTNYTKEVELGLAKCRSIFDFLSASYLLKWYNPLICLYIHFHSCSWVNLIAFFFFEIYKVSLLQIHPQLEFNKINK